MISKPTTSRHRVVVTAHAVRGFRPVTTTPCRLPQQVTHRRSLEFRARACWNARRLARQVLVPAKPCTKPAKRGLAQNACFASLARPRISGAERFAQFAMVRSVAARLCAHCRAHWLGVVGACHTAGLPPVLSGFPGGVSRTLRSGQGRIRHNSLRSAFGTYSGSSLTFATRSGRGNYHFSAGKVAFSRRLPNTTGLSVRHRDPFTPMVLLGVNTHGCPWRRMRLIMACASSRLKDAPGVLKKQLCVFNSISGIKVGFRYQPREFAFERAFNSSDSRVFGGSHTWSLTRRRSILWSRLRISRQIQPSVRLVMNCHDILC